MPARKSPRPRIDRTCKQCGETFSIAPSAAEHGTAVFCSRTCYYASRRPNRTCTCAYCGGVFAARIVQTARAVVYCSARCKGLAQRTEVTLACDQCGKPITRHPSDLRRHTNYFCGQRCRGDWWRAHRSGEKACNRNSKHTAFLPCLICGTRVKRWIPNPPEQPRVFCSNPCYRRWLSLNRSGPNSPYWMGGSTEYRGPGWDAQSEAARKRDSYRCRVCGLSQEDHQRALHVHHIIRFRKFGYIPGKNDNYLQANDLGNLITLCAACHNRVERGTVALPTAPR